MTSGLVPYTELEAVNEILAVGSNSPVSTLNENQVIDASLARNTLRAVLVEILSRGWAFNTEYGVELHPDQDGHIRLPRNTLKVKAVDGSSVVQRGSLLYDRSNRTNKFTSSVTADLVIGMTFEDLPSTVRVCATITAARRYQDRFFGDEAVHSYTLQDEVQAKAAMWDEEIELQGANMLTDSNTMRNLTSRN
ncbi:MULTISPECIES: hypothetical protein [unclassified Brucella]|uniref:hypothetical protein n=1 Tax=unclassified Brucella TaxID=2632610 RepID=UPI0012ADB927|nr:MULTISPECIES: hypothetical protein [unclassified Brucella]MRN79458.1 hypothetical protein [Brucella sp. 10RB9210]UWF59807.1 hypothetical protein NYO66_04660 [Brucella sp. 2716]